MQRGKERGVPETAQMASIALKDRKLARITRHAHHQQAVRAQQGGGAVQQVALALDVFEHLRTYDNIIAT